MHETIATLRAAALAVLLLAAAPGLTFGQDPAPADESPPASAPADEAAPAREVPVPQFTDTMRVEVVNLEVFVTDRRGDPVIGLGPEDFRLVVDGRETAITNFYAEVLGEPRGVEPASPPATAPGEPEPGADAAPELPEQRLHLVIAVDHAHLEAANRRRAFEALSRFVNEGLRPEDSVTVVSLDQGIEMHSDFLNDPATIDTILERISKTSARGTVMEIERRQILDQLARGSSGGFLAESAALTADSNEIMARIRGYAQSEYQRSLGTLRNLDRLLASLAGVPGRKAMVFVSDGLADKPGEDLYAAWVHNYGGGNPEADLGVDRFDFSTNYEEAVGRFDLMGPIGEVAERANAAGVTLYALDAERDHASDLRSAQLEQGVSSDVISIVRTNLRAPLERAADATGGRRVQASAKLNEQLQGIAADFESYYSLGFAPPEGSTGQELDVKVRVEGPWTVRYRELLRPMGDEEQATAATLAALFFNAAGNPLGVVLEAGEPEARQDGARVLPLRIEIPFDRIGVVPAGDHLDARLGIFVSVLEESGAARPVQKLPFHLSIPAEAVGELRGRPAHTVLPVVLRPGDRQVAVGVHDEISGVSSAVRIELDRSGAVRGR